MDTNALIQQAMDFLMDYGPRLLTAIGILIVGYWIAKIVSSLLVRTLNARKIDATVSNFVGKLLFGTLLAVSLIPALGHAGIQTTSILAALGAAGLAVGLALQGSLSNFAAGVLLIAFRPCRVGDYIEAGGTGGTVESISLFSTMLITPDNKRIMIPNSRVMSNPITNYNAMPTRRVDLTIGIPYTADIPKAKALIKEILEKESRILPEPAPLIAVRQLADSSVNLVVRPWVNSSDYWGTHDALLEAIKIALDEADMSIPFPQMDVHFHKEA
ncbi:small conductance mechanosensitive channel [Litorivivens lipolytica]|uniref:Small-conductance mechanosensitive channel n=1 Tax=Litorivivens lipolytica TaxID=1524264 RepID=A0A7W4Z5D9_9GAMM|nr:mechanosensitive ion channel domain-containing protein [Litorivivens lipolytica]MBB3047404.1 small conductance mechanosensitive channel [Litorivivens lipolytica]